MIADKQGGIEWLDAFSSPDTDYGYEAFYSSIDITIQGNQTYRQIKSWDIEFPYPTTKNYVIASSEDQEKDDNVEFICSGHYKQIRELKKANNSRIWLIGGGRTNSLFLREKLIDEIMLFIMPVVLENGIKLFEIFPTRTSLELIDSKTYSNGVSFLHYKVFYPENAIEE